MARFARDCVNKMSSATRKLEVSLGPDTAELAIRVGLHSGAVTAGVLRGDRARFQLFGDTMNTAARMESNGAPNRIHISQETAERLQKQNKGHWCMAREEKIIAKGKGEMQTYWLVLKGDKTGGASSSSGGGTESNSDEDDADFDDNDILHRDVVDAAETSSSAIASLTDKHLRLVDWNTEILKGLLKQVVTRRAAKGTKPASEDLLEFLESDKVSRHTTVLEEVEDVIHLPNFDAEHTGNNVEGEISREAARQLGDYVLMIAALYRNNPFHNFEHASHVTMSTTKLLGRIIQPDLSDKQGDANAKSLHDHTYGITSDPLTQFSVVLASLIHDVDHTGVPNSVLIQEHTDIAAVYKNKSVAEQNSVDLAFDLLMQDSYKDLRRTIYQTEAEFKRFRQLIVNVVMATDIMDKELGAVRKERWEKAFSAAALMNKDTEESVDRKATIVIEHIIQASDIAHTMQHWHIYRKWNQRLFHEMYLAYKQGRLEKNPADFWYEGEKGFFDFYIIPLAKKLKWCGVFGVSSDEYLTYALNNRKEWEHRGEEIVASHIETFDKE